MLLARPRGMVVAALLLVFTNGPLFFTAVHVFEHPMIWEDRTIRPVLVAAAVVAALMVGADRLRVPGLRMRPPHRVAAVAAVAYCVVAVLSTAWSEDPDLTLWRSLVYLSFPLLAWVIADLDDDTGPVLGLVTGAALLASLAIIVVEPSIGLDKNDDWRGIYTNRNSLAPLAAIGLIVGIGQAWGARRRWRAPGATLAVVALVTLLGSGSRTAWLALVVALGLAGLPLLHRAVSDRRGERSARTAVTGTAVAGMLLFTVAMTALWSESTFTQRRTIWDLVWDRVAERPVQGYGFFAVWEIPEFVAGHSLLQRGSAHGSLLEVWLGTGLLGLVPFVVIVVLAARNATADLVRHPGPVTWTWAAVVAFVLIENITESFVLWFSYNWILVMAAALRRPRPRNEPVTEPRHRSPASGSVSAPATS